MGSLKTLVSTWDRLRLRLAVRSGGPPVCDQIGDKKREKKKPGSSPPP